MGHEEAIRQLITIIGDDPQREGLIDTPKRVLKAYRELFSGYEYVRPDGTEDETAVKNVLKIFEDGACDEMVILRNVRFNSFCEHHMLPFSGVAHIAYIPDGKILGLSKLSRILDVYAKRLQVQERLTQQVTQALDTYLEPKGSACVIEATHSCMTCRGVRKEGGSMVTSSLTGAFREEQETRNEFMSLAVR